MSDNQRGARTTTESPAAEGDHQDRHGSVGSSVRSRVAARYPALGRAMPSGTGDAPTIHDAATAAVDNKDGGQPVDGEVAGRVGGHLGADFGGVRVHSDPLAQQATQAMGARAFAHGADIFLGPGESGGDLGLMAHELTHVVQQGAAGQRSPQRKVEVGASDAPAERQADQVASEVTSGQGTPSQLLVDDGPVGPGQMLKSQFMAQLRPQVQAAADDELGPIYAVVGCPYIDQYFGRYANRPAADGEALLRRFAPAARSARTAADLIAPVVARVRQGVRHWRDTGQPPPDIAAAEPGAAAAAAGARPPGAPRTLGSVEAELGPGQPLDGATASRMSDALGVDVSHARIHTGAVAARVAAEAGALAFAVGDNVVMGASAPAAGTLEGDALLAHELAHTAQQRDAASAPLARMMPIDGESVTAEDHADQAAAGAVARLHGDRAAEQAGERRGLLARMAGRVADGFKTGLQLQRCPDNPSGGGGGPTADEQAAMTHNSGLGYDGDSIRSIQRLVGATESGTFDLQTIQHITTWQAGRSLAGKGKIDAATLKAIVQAMLAASLQDNAIHLIVDAYNLPTTNLARIYWDPTCTSADAVTSGTIGTGNPQTVRVGPSTFAGSYEHAVKIIGHELQHVQQRSGATPITNQNIREFLAYAWEALDTTTPALTPSERVNHANIAIRYYNRLSTGEKASYVDTYNKLQTLISNGGVGNP